MFEELIAEIETAQTAIRHWTTAQQIRKIDDGDNRYEFVAATEEVARDGGIIRMKGARLDNFKLNPVIQWKHDMTSAAQPVIARAVKMTVDRQAKSLIITAEFPKAGTSALADEVRSLVDQGFIRAVSVGFIIHAFAELTEADRSKMGLGNYGWVATDWEMTELSIVPVGSDPRALKRALETGKITERQARMASGLPMPQARIEAPSVEVPAIVSDKILDLIEALRENTAAQKRTAEEVTLLVDVLDATDAPTPVASRGTAPVTDAAPVESTALADTARAILDRMG